MIGAASLNVHVYEEVEADRSATFQALFVVVLVSLATGIGSLSVGGVDGLIFGILFGIVAWGLWAFITYFVGTRLLPTPETEANWGQLLRTLGFAQSPGMFRVFGFIPIVGPIIFFATVIWQLFTMVIAVRQALDYQSTWRAVGVVFIGYIPYVLFLSLFLTLVS